MASHINQADAYEYLFKVVYVGDSGVGKSQMLGRFARDEFFLDVKSTIGIEFATKNIPIGDKIVKAQIWDTAGQERYRSITNSYFRGAVGVILVYDITRHASYQNAITNWLQQIRDYADPDVHVILIGNKCDLRHLRAITIQEATDFAKANNLKFMETSALDKTNIEEAHQLLLSEIAKDIAQKEMEAKATMPLEKGNTISLGNTRKKKSNDCC